MSDNYYPLVSVIIPLFNREKLIGETLSSVIFQTYQHWEVLVVDDGSTDNSYKFVEEIITKEPRIKLFRRNRVPKGAPTCRNIGVEKATGKYLIFLDSDDLLAPYCLENRVKVMETDSTLDFAVFLMMDFKKTPGDTKTLWNVFNDRNDLERFLSSDLPWAITSPIWRSKAFAILGKWDEAALRWQDWEIHIRALAMKLNYIKIESLPDCFVRRDDSDRMSKEGYTYRSISARGELFIRVHETLKQNDVNPSVIRLLAGYFYTYAEIATLNNIGLDAKKMLKNALKLNLINNWVFFVAWQSIVIRSFFHSKSFFVSRIIRRTTRLLLPSYMIMNPTSQHRIKLSKDKYEELIKLLTSLDNKSNFIPL